MRRLLSILLWSVIAAAFIGPGTVTTAAKAGAETGHALLWALVFSTFGCFVLQEAAARVAIVSGQDLARALRERSGPFAVALIVGAILVGCAAYEAGNIVGGAVGAALALPAGRPVLVLAIAALALVVLLRGSAGGVSRAMGAIVALMGLAFLTTAIRLEPAPAELMRGLVVPALPAGSGLLVVALVGTTIVPYNLFLGSGLAVGQRLDHVRLGLAIAVGLGGAISMAVVVVGTSLDGPFRFEAVGASLGAALGDWAQGLFGIGLFCAGFSSAVTAPLAAAITARGLFGRSDDTKRWSERGTHYRTVWIAVLAAGVAFGLSGLQPVPVIVLAQALNGLLLPIAAGFLVVLVNDRRVMGAAVNGTVANVAIGITFAVAVLLGAANLLRAAHRTLGLAPPGSATLAIVGGALTAAAAWPLVAIARRRRRG